MATTTTATATWTIPLSALAARKLTLAYVNTAQNGVSMALGKPARVQRRPNLKYAIVAITTAMGSTTKVSIASPLPFLTMPSFEKAEHSEPFRQTSMSTTMERPIIRFPSTSPPAGRASSRTYRLSTRVAPPTEHLARDGSLVVCRR